MFKICSTLGEQRPTKCIKVYHNLKINSLTNQSSINFLLLTESRSKNDLMISICTFLAQIFYWISLCTVFSANKEEEDGKSFYIKLINLQQVIFKSAEAKWRSCFFPLYWSSYTNGLLALYFVVSQGLSWTCFLSTDNCRLSTKWQSFPQRFSIFCYRISPK